MSTFHSLDMVETRLRDWAVTALKSDVSFGLPENVAASKDQVHFYLLDLQNTPRPRAGLKRPAAQIILRYLAMASASEPGKESRLVCELLFDAMENTDIELESEAVPLQLWSALGISPRPAFLFRIGVVRLREETSAPMVKRIVVRSAPIAGMNGTVLGPGDVPLSNALVELPSLRTSARTDLNGRFNFAAVPPGPQEIELIVKARGKEMSVRTAAQREPDSLVVINFTVLEN